MCTMAMTTPGAKFIVVEKPDNLDLLENYKMNKEVSCAHICTMNKFDHKILILRKCNIN